MAKAFGAVRALDGASRVARVETALPATLALAARREATTRAAVIVVVLLAAVVSLSALALAGRLVTALRAGARPVERLGIPE